MSTARHSPCPLPLCSRWSLVFFLRGRYQEEGSFSLSLSLSLLLLSSAFNFFLASFFPLFLPRLSLSLSCPVSAHRPRARPPRLSGKPWCEPLTVTKVSTYKRGLIPRAARGNSRIPTWESAEPSSPRLVNYANDNRLKRRIELLNAMAPGFEPHPLLYVSKGVE